MPEQPSDRWRQIEGLYHRALDRAAGEREAFLDETCQGDDGLRREVRSLLALEGAAESFLARPALAEAATALAQDSAALAGCRVGGYEVSTLLGTGGMGEVYRARDVRLGREVALKVLAPSIAADPAYLRRFEEEARSASVLNHPNIVTIYGVGEEGDLAFIAMELVQGRTLREHMAAEPMPMKTALDVAAQLAGALAAAHESGIVHRDLKPENVMVTPDGLVKVLDFGIARRQGRAPAPAAGSGDLTETRTTGTQAGTIIGTVGYMSPEQASGKPASFASDQFSLGAILYEMLSGRRAFQRDSRIETLAAIIDGQPTPVETLNPRVPGAVRQVLARCLAKDPERRYPNTRDLEVELRRIKEPTHGVTRRQLLWFGAGTAAAAATGVATWQLWPADPRIAVLPFTSPAKDEDAESLSYGLTTTLIDRIHRLPITVMAYSLVSNFKKEADPRIAGRALRVQTVLTGTVRRQSGRLLITAELIDVATGASVWSRTYNRASEDLLAVQDEIATAIVADGLHLHPTQKQRELLLKKPTTNVEAFELFARGRLIQMGESEQDYLEARDLFEQAIDLDRNFAEAYVALAGTYWTTAIDGFERPTEAWPAASGYVQKAMKLNPDLPDAHIGRANVFFFSEYNWSEAEREYEIAIAADNSEIEPELLIMYAFERWAMGRPHESLALVRRARQIDGLSPIFIFYEATYLVYTGALAQAGDMYVKAAREYPEDSRLWFGLAEVRHAQQHFDDAIAARRRGHELVGDDRNEAFKDVLMKARGAEGYRQIEVATQRLIELPRLEGRAPRDQYASPLDFARAYAQLGDTERALTYLKAAYVDRASALVFLNADRAWDLIRDDARFQEVVRKLQLPPRTR